MTIQPLGKVLIAAGAAYLNVFSATHAFIVHNADEQLPPTTVKAGFAYDVQSYHQLWVENPSTTEVLMVDLEISPLRVLSGGNSSVEISNVPTIQKIVEPIAVTAQATVENGTVSLIRPDALVTSIDKTIPANSRLKVASALVGRDRVFLQILSGTTTVCRVGDVSCGSNRGVLVSGDINNPGSVDMETSGDVYVFNTDMTNTATVSVLEVNKA